MIKKIGLGAGFWAVMFIGISALIVTPLPEIVQQILGAVLAGIAGYILAMIYFKKTLGSIKDGLILAAIWFFTSLVLDLLITIQYVKAEVRGGYIDGLKSFYGSWDFWVGVILMFVGVAVASKFTHGDDIVPIPRASISLQPSAQPGQSNQSKTPPTQPTA